VTATGAPVLRLISDSTELARRLQHGGFCALRWELGGDLAERKRYLDVLCRERGTYLEFIDIPRKSLTIVVNIKAVPPDELSYDLVTAIEHDRWRQRKSP
jgi:hypothetical protein